MGTQSEKFETSPAFHRKYMGAGGNGYGGDEHGAALNKSRRIYGDDNNTFFRLIAMARQSLGQICPAISSKWVMPKHKWMMLKHG